MDYKNKHANKSHSERKTRMKDTSIIQGKRPYVGSRSDSEGTTDHLTTNFQTKKPSRSSTDRTDLSETWLMKAATDGKISGTDHDHRVDEGFGWSQGEWKDSGLANNLITTAQLSTHPDSTLGGGTEVHQAPPESAHPRLTPMRTVSRMRWNYKPVEWC